MYQVITIGSALVDIFIYAEAFKSKADPKGDFLCQRYGDKIEIDSFKVYSGGGASNTAVAFSRLGLRSAIICETGRDSFQQIVINELINEGVETNFIVREKKEQTGGSVILVGEKGQRIIMVHRGASSMLDSFDIPTFWLSKAGWVHLSSIAGKQDTLEKIFKILNKEKNIGLSWNPGKAELALLREQKIKIEEIPCKILFLNKEEWQILEPVHQQILKTISQVLVTDGSKGGDLFLMGKYELRYQSDKVKSIDNTGAGDAFAAAYTASQILSHPPKTSIQWGIKNACSVVKYFGAKTGLVRREQMQKLVV
ncbi:MAG: carbohydrate kinase family protein [Candidatus Woesebacteria bacterium]|jgi:sugar/nucleoside kinase (ribokinase family)